MPTDDHAHGTNSSEASEAKTRLTSRKGWFPVVKFDFAFIVENCGETSASVWSVWTALLLLKNDRRTSDFVVTTSLIAHLAGVHRNTVKRAIKELVAFGFVTVEHRGPEGKQPSDASRYQLLKGVAHKEPRGSSQRATGVDQGSRTLKSRKLKELPSKAGGSRKKRIKNARALSRGSSGSAGAAGPASGASGEMTAADTWRKPARAQHQ